MPSRPALALTALVTATLLVTSCAGGDDPALDPEPISQTPMPTDLCAAAAPDAPVLDAIDVTGDFGAAPEVTFDTPLEVAETARRVIIDGDGDKIEAGQNLMVAVSWFNAETGDKLGESGYDEVGVTPTFVSPGFVGHVTGCAPLGSRIVMATAATEDTATSAARPAEVQVFDLVKVMPDPADVPNAADGEPQTPDADFPAVTVADSGAPSIADATKAKVGDITKVSVLKQGDGDEVRRGDTVIVQYTGVKVSDGETFDSSWQRGEPATFTVQDGGLIQGFVTALVGQKVGSQVIAVIPGAEAYGAEADGTHELAGEDLIFVVDILATERIGS